MPKPAILALFLILAAWFSPRAAAQDAPEAQGEVTITCPWLGVGGVVRPGEWVGLRLGINDSASRPREILVRIAIPDADGDRVQFERSMTTNPGVPQPLWMYVRLPSRFGAGDSLNVTAWAAVEEAGSAAGDRGALSAGRLLGAARLTRPVVVDRADGMMAVVGDRFMGLRDYGEKEVDDRGAARTFLGHERSHIVTRLDPEILPDRWIGLSPFDVIVWNEPSPTSLGTDRAQAIREWVQRGGHLVVVLPRVGQAWTNEVNNPLADIVPRVSVRRRDGVDLEPYRTLIARSPTLQMPRDQVVQTFTPLPDAGPDEAICVIAGAPGDDGNAGCLVTRRLVGTGMVTLVGLDAASRWMDQNRYPDPELFWNRILGRRGQLTGSSTRDGSLISSFREPLTLDNVLPDQIAKRGQAAAGVLMGFVVFVVYWLIAGPAGYAVLKRAGLSKHGWAAFVAAAALFTGVAWGGATLIRPSRIEAKHLTFVDHVYGQTVDRTRTWMSLLVPEYGEATVIVGDPASRERARFHNLIAPWEPVGAGADGFPDARGYRIDVRRPDEATIPTRATVKQMQADWAGAPTWNMPRPVYATDSQDETPIRLAPPTATSLVTGVLVHDLPAPLTDAVLIVNAGQRPISRSIAGTSALTAQVSAYKLEGWLPGVPLDLAQITPRERSSSRTAANEYLAGLLTGRSDTDGVEVTPNLVTLRLTALAFFTQVEPPSFQSARGQGEKIAQRRYTHGMDLGEWFTQPCLIVVGHVGAGNEEEPSPTPLFIRTGGPGSPAKAIRTAGRTVVRWVYPLGERPPHVPAGSDDTIPGPPIPPLP